MSDITIINDPLDSLISELEIDNQNIDITIKEINSVIKSLDESKWKSYEKDRLDEKLLPYLDNIEKNMYNYLNDCTVFLKNAHEKYINTNSNIEKSLEDVGDIL